MARVWLIATVVAAAALGPAVAVAAGPRLPAPALAQYVEAMPTAEGPIVTAATKPRVHDLPAAVRKKVVEKGGADAAVIEAIATSSTYGAPQTTLKRRAAAPPSGVAKPAAVKTPTTVKKPHGVKQPAVPAAAAIEPSQPTFSTDGSGGSRLPILGAFMVAATVGLGVAARRSRD